MLGGMPFSLVLEIVLSEQLVCVLERPEGKGCIILDVTSVIARHRLKVLERMQLDDTFHLFAVSY